jgi:hypothetical protein
MAFAFNTGCLIDHVGDAVTFTDGFGRAIGYARAAGDAIFGNFHGHGCFSVKGFDAAIKLSYAMACVN